MTTIRAVLVVAAMCALGGPALAQQPVAVAEQRFDVDANGTIDVVRIEENASVTIALTGGAEPVWKPFRTTGAGVRKGRIQFARTSGRTIIVATAEFGPRRGSQPSAREVMVLAWERGRVVEVLQQSVGPQGRDGEWSLHVELIGKRVVRYQSRPGVVRCDRKTPYLFAEAYSFSKRAFVNAAAMPPRLDSATILDATRSAPSVQAEAAAPLAFRFRATSTDEQAMSANDLVPPRELDDGNGATAWRGFGRGAFASAFQRSDYLVRAIRIVPGDAGSARAFAAAKRLKQIGVLVGDQAFRVRFAPDPKSGLFDAPYWLEFDPPIRATCVSIVADQFYGPSRGASAIAEIAVLTDLELAPERAGRILSERVALGGPKAATALDQLSRMGAAGVDALVSAAVTAGDPLAQQRLRAALAVIAARGGPMTDAAVEQLVAGLGTGGSSERRRFRTALAKQGDRAVPALGALSLRAGAPLSVRDAAVGTLEAIPGPLARDALIAGAGVGEPDLRKRRVFAMSRRDVRELDALVGAAQAAATATPYDEGREADLWRAVGAAARKTTNPGAAADAMATRLAGATTYELRYRLLAALGRLPAAPAIAAVRAALVGLPPDARGVALRRVAIGALGINKAEGAVPVLVAAVDDADPETRALAIEALGTSPHAGPDTDGLLIARLSSDRWPQVRRAAAGTLGIRCKRDGVADALYAHLIVDDDIPTRATILTSLMACGEPRIVSELQKVAANRSQPAELRTLATSLLAETGDAGLAPWMIGHFKRVKREVWSDKSAIRIAEAAAGALGALGDASAVPALLSAAQDDAFPDIQIAAITAIGRMCPRSRDVASALRRLLRSDHRQVRRAAARAVRRCYRR